ncbi:MAG: glycerate kinase [Advenella sp.]|uniref:glycerate kinase n=1 Tax=Advenella sp. TaxID=1872388 RepID=UPI0025855E66|nr:glycerate kinase [Advenella sp.]MDD3757074.1 glycerate kinase [Advenella sp.]
MKIIIAPDSFKESLPAHDVAKAIAKGVMQAAPDANIHCVPMADGGEGTVLAIAQSTPCTLMQSTVRNALGHPVQATWAMHDTGTAIIEMASAAGLEQIQPQHRNILRANTFGVGQLILEALNRNVKHIILGLGGSATNDGGAGMLAALGIQFKDKNNALLEPVPEALSRLEKIDLSGLEPRLAQTAFTLASDVSNPLCGSHGAAAIFGPQKGATPEQARLLDQIMANYADITAITLGRDRRHEPGAGAAGGLGFAGLSFLNARFRPGVEIVAEFAGLADLIENADLIITGEGKLDDQTLQGKALAGIAALAQMHQVPMIVIAGTLGSNYQALYSQGMTAAFSLCNGPITLQDAMQHTSSLLQDRSRDIMRVFMAKQIKNGR